MKTTTRNLNTFLLSATLALPLAAYAMDEAPGASDQGPRAGERRGPPPDTDNGPRGDDERDGPRGPGGRGPGPRGDGPDTGFGFAFDGIPPHLRGLDLSEAQADKIFAILHEQIPFLRQQDRAREKAGRALFDLHGAAKYDDAAAVRLAQAVAQADANVTLSHLRTEQKVLAVLSAAQRKQLDERRQQDEQRPPRRAGGHPSPQ